jgi:hypothetical protein
MDSYHSLDPDPHESGKLGTHLSEKQFPDPHQSEKQDPDPQHWRRTEVRFVTKKQKRTFRTYNRQIFA